MSQILKTKGKQDRMRRKNQSHQNHDKNQLNDQRFEILICAQRKKSKQEDNLDFDKSTIWFVKNNIITFSLS